MVIDLNRNGKADVEELRDNIHEKLEELGQTKASAKDAVDGAKEASGPDVDGKGSVGGGGGGAR